MQKSNLYGEMACTNRGDFVSQASERPKTFRFFSGAPFATNAVPEKMSEKVPRGAKKKINAALKHFNFRENDYNSAGNSHFWA